MKTNVLLSSLYSTQGRALSVLSILFLTLIFAATSTTSWAAHDNPAVVTTISVGDAPIGVGVNPATNRMYVTNSWLDGPPRDDTVSVIDGASDTVVATIALGPLCSAHHTGNCLPADVGINPNTNRIYLPNFLDDSFSVIDGTPGSPTENMVIAAAVPVGNEPCRVAVNPITDRVYMTNLTPDLLTVIDGTPGSPTEHTVLATVAVGNGPCGVGVNSTTNKVYVANFLAGTVSVIDGNSNAVIATIPVGSNPANVAVNSVTNRVYVPNQSSNTLSVIDGATDTVIATLPMAAAPFAVDVNSNTNQIYVATGFQDAGPAGNVVIIDGSSNTAVATLPIGDDPADIAVNPVTDRAYVANHLDDTVSVIADDVTQVAIDIKPGDDTNLLSCDQLQRDFTVAILTTPDFDALSVDHSTVSLAGASEVHTDRNTGEPSRHEKDIDRDGDLDLLFHFRLGETNLTCTSTEATLVGQTYSGTAIEGTDSVWMQTLR